MAGAIAVHLVYVLLAALLYSRVSAGTAAAAPLKRRAIRSGVAPLLFSPGILWTWPFGVPTFALLALVTYLASVATAGTWFLPQQIATSLGPILFVWLVL